jgi:hypothetical protein
MLTIINTIIDRCFFTASFIFALQLPEYIKKYTDTLLGKLDEAQFQLSQFEKIAEKHDQGSLSAMVVRANEQSDSAITNTAELIELLTTRIANYQNHLSELTQSDYFSNLCQLIVNIDWYIAQITAEKFILTLPINAQAITTGIIVATTLLLLKDLILILINRMIGRGKGKAKPNNSLLN